MAATSNAKRPRVGGGTAILLALAAGCSLIVIAHAYAALSRPHMSEGDFGFIVVTTTILGACVFAALASHSPEGGPGPDDRTMARIVAVILGYSAGLAGYLAVQGRMPLNGVVGEGMATASGWAAFVAEVWTGGLYSLLREGGA